MFGQISWIQSHGCGEIFVPRFEPILHVVDKGDALINTGSPVVEPPNDLLDDLGKL